MRTAPLFGALAVSALIASAEAAQARCDPGPAQFALGQAYSSRVARQAKRASGARVVRRLAPGAMYTMDYSPARLNIETDRHGRITRLRCG